MRIEQLQYIVLLGKLKSISLVAEQFYMSQPSMSSSIRKLENELGATLFKRSILGVNPTETGEIIINKAQEVLNRIDEIKQIAAMSNSSDEGIINIGAIPCMFDNILPTVLVRLRENYPKIDITLRDDESINILNKVQSGEVDLGIVIETDEMYKKDVIFEKLISDEFVVYVGKNSPLATKKTISLEEVFAQPYIAYNDEFLRNKGGISNLMAKHGTPKQVLFRLNNTEITKKIIALGTAITFFPKFMAKDSTYSKQGEIIPVSIEGASLGITISLIRLKNHTLSKIERAFIEILRLICAQVVTDK